MKEAEVRYRQEKQDKNAQEKGMIFNKKEGRREYRSYCKCSKLRVASEQDIKVGHERKEQVQVKWKKTTGRERKMREHRGEEEQASEI